MQQPSHPFSPVIRSEKRFALCLTLLFCAAACAAVATHEPWRDEIQKWLIARDSTSPIDLFRNIRYEGHPGLWYFCLWIASRFTHSPAAMQITHLAISTAAVYLMARHSPFSRIQRGLFAFGFFPFYEYTVLSRNYGIGMLLLFAFCCLFPKRNERFLGTAVVLFLLANTNVYMLIVASLLAAVLAIDFLLSRRAPPAWKTAVGFTVIGTGMLLSILEMIPPLDGGFARLWKFSLDIRGLERTINTVVRGYFPLLQIRSDFYVSPLFFEKFRLFLKFEFVCSLAVIAGAALVFLRRPAALAVFLGGTVGLWLFFYSKYLGSLRHHGLLYILFVVSAWLYGTGPPNVIKSSVLRRWNAALEKLFHPAVTVLFGLHVAVAAVAVTMDVGHVFSCGKATAAFIRREAMQGRVMAGHMDSNVVSVIGYLDKREIYFPHSDRFGSYVIWTLRRNAPVSDSVICERVKALAVRSKQDVLFIVHYPFPLLGPGVKPLASFTGSMIRDEDFYLYNVPTIPGKGDGGRETGEGVTFTGGDTQAKTVSSDRF